MRRVASIRYCRLFSILPLAIALVLPASAQESRASIVGRAVDSSNAVVVGTKISARNLQTGVAASATTNESGAFLIPFLLPGKYKLTAEKSGFKVYSTDLELRVNDSLDVTVRLDLGSIAETVEVSAGTPLLETSNSSVGQVIDERRLMELPQRRGYARVAFIPPAASITEFKMQSIPYDASVGHALGPVINVGTKSGSNGLHGEIYYWSRNSAFDSANFFDNKAGLKKAVYQDHRYGGSAGGPVVIPSVYNGRNKTFWFFAWEENRFGQPSTSNQTSTVPTAQERVGDFSALLALGAQYQVYNPFTTRAATAGRFQRDPFPGNVIPKSLLSPVGLNLAALYPLPSQASTIDGRNNFFYPDVRQQLYDSYLTRFDYAFTPNHRLFLRMNHFAYEIPKNLL